MPSPTVSVIIPSYNYARHVAGAIQSVLDQTYKDFELIVVDDGSQDDTAVVVNGFSDPRVQYIYQENKGLPGARNTGIRASSGQFLAFLDSDDQFHPHKLASQIDFLTDHPEVGLCYNSRILVDPDGNFLQLRRAPETVSLEDLVLGYPFAPSDVVIRRDWAFKVGLFDESYVANSEDLNFHIRLLLAGCQFAGLPQALAYRQIHTGRRFGNLPRKLATYFRALDTAFDDPRCPAQVRALREQAYADHYLTWGYQAAVQQETKLAHNYLLQAVQLNPSLLEQDGAALGHLFVHASIRDGGDHAAALHVLLANLPPELTHLRAEQDKLIARGYLMRGIRDIIWERQKIGQSHLQQAASRGARLDDALLNRLSDQMTHYAAEFGDAAASQIWEQLRPSLKPFGSPTDLRRFSGAVAVNQAFHSYQAREFAMARRKLVKAIANDPRYLANRGVLSIMFRSLLGAARL